METNPGCRWTGRQLFTNQWLTSGRRHPGAVTLHASTHEMLSLQQLYNPSLGQWVQGQAKTFKQFCLQQAALSVTRPAFRPSNFVSVQEAVMGRWSRSQARMLHQVEPLSGWLSLWKIWWVQWWTGGPRGGGRNILTTFTRNRTINSHKGKRSGSLSKCPPNDDETLETPHVSIAVCVYPALRLTGYLNRETGVASESGRERKTSMWIKYKVSEAEQR